MVINYNTNIKLNKDKLVDFLETQGLSFDDNIDTCLVIKENNKIVACACKKDNVFKMIAVSCKYQSLDYVAKLISALIELCYEENIYHYFIFTKMIYVNHFTSIGFKLLVTYQDIGLFEMGRPLFDDYYDNIEINQGKNAGAIVMNCNPFTLGHRYLIEEALKIVDELVVFIVEEDKSFFKFKDRIELVRQGVADLKNVKVVSSGPYIISQVTFPTYFLKSLDEHALYYTNIDILLFKEIMRKLGINKRFVGNEPTDKLTNFYNEQLIINLKEQLVIIERKKTNNDYISASKVRKFIDDKNFEEIKNYVNKITYDFIMDNFKKE